MVSMCRPPVEAVTLRTVAKLALRLPHILRHAIAYLVLRHRLQHLIALGTAGEERALGVELEGVNDLLELLAEAVAADKHEGRRVFSAEQPGISRQNEPSLPLALAHHPLRGELGQGNGVIPQDTQPFGQLTYHTVGQKAGRRSSRQG